VEVGSTPPPRRGRTPSRDGAGAWWSPAALVALAAAALVAVPLLVLPASFLAERGEVWRRLWDTVLPEALRSTALLVLGVGTVTLVLGVSLAVLVSFYDFPGRGTLAWALVLPLAMPGYVLSYVLLRQWDVNGPIQTFLRDRFGAGAALPEIRSLPGAIIVLSLVLYPYVYLLTRSALLGQSRSDLEAARSLGASHLGSIRRVALPAARPAIAAGVALAVMESLADFGTVNLLRVETITDAVYRVWYGQFDREGATQLATLLLGAALLVVVGERLLRGRRRYHQNLRRGVAVTPVRLHGLRAALALAGPLLVLAVAFAGPALELAFWGASALAAGEETSDFAHYARNSLLLGVVTAIVTCAIAGAIGFGLRAAPSRLGRAAARVASLGYALPGSVVAAAVIVVYSWVDRRWIEAGDALGMSFDLLLTGSAIGLILAYVVRFLAIALGTIEAHLARVPPSFDEAARGLGVTGLDTIRRVHLPLLRPGLLAALLLVFVDVVKELPATMLLRPFGWDTLAVGVWQATSDGRWEAAALPALCIVLIGLVPVAVLVRLSRIDLGS
jgi:iron(III) transport system permease protein